MSAVRVDPPATPNHINIDVVYLSIQPSLPENFYKKYPVNSNKAAAAAAAVHVVLLFHIFVWLTEIEPLCA
jgi:hypothetical protein